MIVKFKKNTPYIEGVNLSKLAKKIPTPFYVYSQKKIIDSYLNLYNILKKEIFYSVKANSNQAIIALLNSIGSGCDVVSKEELIRSLKAGVPAKKIIFEGVGKSEEDIKFAIKKRIRQINVESIQELETINKISKSLKLITSIGIRINPNIDSKTFKKISTGKKNDKFGIDYNDIQKACKIIKTSKNISLKGISCHVGSQIFQIKVFEKLFTKMKKAANLVEKYDIYIENLDLGGGFGVPYTKTNNRLNIIQVKKLVNRIFKNSTYKISFEPGRFIVAQAGIIITKIITTKQNSKINYIIVDAGMNTFLRPSMYNASHNIISFNKSHKKMKYTLAGPICESSDIIKKNIKLPKQEVGNYLAICDTGAYGAVMASNYNSKCLPAEVLINKNKFVIIRNSQNINSLLKLDKIPKWI